MSICLSRMIMFVCLSSACQGYGVMLCGRFYRSYDISSWEDSWQSYGVNRWNSLSTWHTSGWWIKNKVCMT